MKTFPLCAAAVNAGANLESNTLLQATKINKRYAQHHAAFGTRNDPDSGRQSQDFMLQEEGGCIDMYGQQLETVSEDCTFKDFFVFKGTTEEATAGFVEPTYPPDEYGEDDWWKTMPVHHGEWQASCVAYVKMHETEHETCNHWCEGYNMTCVRGADDAHHQTEGLSTWLATDGYEATDCTLLPSGHDRQDGDESGCQQEWATQVCACARPTTTTTTTTRGRVLDNREGCVIQPGVREFIGMSEDCTFKDFFEFKGSVEENRGPFIQPSNELRSIYGSDEKWETMPVQSGEWAGTCVAYVHTNGTNCSSWCASNGMMCQKAMDDAHWQTDDLSSWLSDDGYPGTDCTLHPASSERQTADEDGCLQTWKTQICACAAFREPATSYPPSGERGCLDEHGDVWVDLLEDCTNSDFFEFRAGITDASKPPSYDPTTYGGDAFWLTKKVQADDWKGSCVAYVQTNGTDCKSWCEGKGMNCVKGMDDAHHQTAGLSEWLDQGGYKPTDCTILPQGHYRQVSEENGCLQRWNTQICACN